MGKRRWRSANGGRQTRSCQCAGIERQEAYVAGLNIPAELVWGMNDPILAKGLLGMREMFPAAPVIETDAGHFLQEEVPEVIAAAVMRVVDAAQKK